MRRDVSVSEVIVLFEPKVAVRGYFDTPAVRALVLDRTHRCLLLRAPGGLCVPEVAGPWNERPLDALRRSVRDVAGLALGSPAGSRVPVDGRGPRDFVFLAGVEAAPIGDAWTWAPLPSALGLAIPDHAAWLWSTYVACVLGGWEPPTRALDVWSFGDGPELAAKLAHLVTCGQKRGTAGWLRAAELEGVALPRPGGVSIVTDWHGYPRCAIRTEEVLTLRFADMDGALAAEEGEGDLTLDDWRAGHLAFFGREAERLELAFDEDEEIVFERFRVLRVLGQSDEG